MELLRVHGFLKRGAMLGAMAVLVLVIAQMSGPRGEAAFSGIDYDQNMDDVLSQLTDVPPGGDHTCLADGTSACSTRDDVDNPGSATDEYIVSLAFIAPDEIVITGGASIVNAAEVGVANANVTIDIGAGCNQALPITNLQLYDGELQGGVTDVTDSAIALASPFSWSSRLDGIVTAVTTANISATLHARAVGFVTVLGSPIPANVLIFDQGMAPGWLTIPVIGDPTTAAAYPSCPPEEFHIKMLGEVPATDAFDPLKLVRTCDTVGTHTFAFSATGHLGDTFADTAEGYCSESGLGELDQLHTYLDLDPSTGPCEVPGVVENELDVPDGGDFQVAVCVGNPPAALGPIQFSVLYDDTVILAPDGADLSSPALDANPDVDQAALGDGLNCNVLDMAPPKGDKNPASGAGNGEAFVGCTHLAGSYLFTSTGAIALIDFDAVAQGDSDLDLDTVVLGNEGGVELGTCNPGVLKPMPCLGGEVHVKPAATMSFTKSSDPIIAVFDSSMDFTITVSNVDADDDALLVSLHDVVDTSFDIDCAADIVIDPVDGRSCTCTDDAAGDYIDCDLGTIAVGDSVTVTYTVDVVGAVAEIDCNDAEIDTTSEDVLLGGTTEVQVCYDIQAPGSVMAKVPVINEPTSNYDPAADPPQVNLWLCKGADDDLDGLVDEDPAGDANDDGCPGICGVDDDLDGQIDEGDAADDDEDCVGDPPEEGETACSEAGGIDEDGPEFARHGCYPYDGKGALIVYETFQSIFDKDSPNDDDDGDGYSAACADDPSGEEPFSPEPANGVDDNGDGFIDNGDCNDNDGIPGVEDEFPEGLGAYEFQLKFDHKIFDITISDPADDGVDNDGDGLIDGEDEDGEGGFLGSTGRLVDCSMSILTENDIRFGCVSKARYAPPYAVYGGGGLQVGPSGPGPFAGAVIMVTPEPDLVLRLRPAKDNGVIRTLLNENCEITDTLAEAMDATLPGGLTTFCEDLTVTIRMLEGDLDLDCDVDVVDDQIIAFRYGAFFGSLLYDPFYDMEPRLTDFDIDIKDLQFVFGRNGSTCQDPYPPQVPMEQPN